MRRDVFQAIADPNRRAIIQIVANKKLTLGEVADHFELSRQAISKHVAILKECGLINIEQQGRKRYCQAQLQHLQRVSDWIEQYRTFWTKKLDALEDFLSKES